MKIDIPMVLAFILLAQMVGVIGAFINAPSISPWYASLNKPSFAPPNEVFGPVWITLYLLMGISAYLIWEKGCKKKIVCNALTLFGFQLAINACWPLAFFALRSPLAGLMVAIALVFMVAVTFLEFYKL